jgi:hypothetical protein
MIMATSGEDEKDPPVEMLADTGVPTRVDGYDFPVVHDLGTLVIPDRGVPLCFRHDELMRIGHVDVVRVRAGRLVAKGWLSASDLLAWNVTNSLKRQHVAWWQVSCGTGCDTFEFVGPDEVVRVNGRDVLGPSLIARKTRLVEISITPDAEAADTGTFIILGTAHFDSGTMPSRLGLVKAEFTAEREAVLARQRLDLEMELIRLEKEAKARVQAERDREARVQAERKRDREHYQMLVRDREREAELRAMARIPTIEDQYRAKAEADRRRRDEVLRYHRWGRTEP